MGPDQLSADPAIVLISNSKIYNDTQEYWWKKNGYKVNQENYSESRGFRDCCRRINYFKLINAVRYRHRLTKEETEVRLYGSEPPNMKAVCEKIRLAVPNVNIYQKSIKGKEKQTVTKLVADAVEHIILSQNPYEKNTGKRLVLLGGDEDMLPLIQIAAWYGWKVNVWAYETLMPRTSRILELWRSREIELVPLEEYSHTAGTTKLPQVTFNHWKYGSTKKSANSAVQQRIHNNGELRSKSELGNRGFVILFKHHELKSWGKQGKARIKTENIVSTKIIELTSKALQLPAKGCFLNPEKTHFFVFISIQDHITDQKGQNVEVYDYNIHIVTKFSNIKETLNSNRRTNIEEKLDSSRGNKVQDSIPECEDVLPYIRYCNRFPQEVNTNGSSGFTESRFQLFNRSSENITKDSLNGAELASKSKAVEAPASSDHENEVERYVDEVAQGRWEIPMSKNRKNMRRKQRNIVDSCAPCPFKFWCTRYRHGGKAHSKEEQDYYAKNAKTVPKGKNRLLYKTDLCDDSKCRLRGDEKNKLYLCPFSHAASRSSSSSAPQDLMRCITCRKEGHLREDCPNKSTA